MTIFAIIFPGQGSQKVGMLTELASHNSIIKETFSEASSVLGYDLWNLIQIGPVEKLNQTHYAQPALLASSVAIWRLWKQKNGKQPILFAGHSLGEYSALVCSGSLDFMSAIKLVRLRGIFMQEAVPLGEGSMSAIIGLNNSDVIDACQQAKQEQIVAPASFNSPDQIVIAGHTAAVERASILCKKAGAKYILPLPISIPSHCLLMKKAAEKLSKELDLVVLSHPQIPFINNVDVCLESNPKNIKQALIRQMYNPVRWYETIEYLANQGVDILLEMGPGHVLTKLNKRMINTISSVAINNIDSLMKVI